MMWKQYRLPRKSMETKVVFIDRVLGKMKSLKNDFRITVWA